MGCYKHTVRHVVHSDELIPYDSTLAHIKRHTSVLILCNGLMTEKHITNYKTIKKRVAVDRKLDYTSGQKHSVMLQLI